MQDLKVEFSKQFIYHIKRSYVYTKHKTQRIKGFYDLVSDVAWSLWWLDSEHCKKKRNVYMDASADL
jgi:hypothetical protein